MVGKRCAERRGFSLAEIVVVVGIIGVLMAIIIPSVQSVRDRAWEAECQSNLRNIGTFMASYRQKSDGVLPRAAPLPSGDPYAPPDGLNGVFAGLHPTDSRVYLCPADDDPTSVEIGTSYFYVAGAFMLISPLGEFAAARETTRFFEGPAGNGIPLVWDSVDRHFIGTDLPRNGLFWDGHVERVGEPFTIPGQSE